MGIDVKLLSMVNLIVMILFVCHWNGCLQFIAACFQGYPDNSWVVNEKLITNNGNVTEHTVGL